jgi:hypothetical protein
MLRESLRGPWPVFVVNVAVGLALKTSLPLATRTGIGPATNDSETGTLVSRWWSRSTCLGKDSI